jgi:deoxyxylulose-5-phosphate synthase
MSWWIQAVQQTLSLQKLSDRCKSKRIRYKMQHPLCGFGGKQIVALEKITMSITFGYVHNTRTEKVVFDVVDMDYPYNAIIGQATLNAFEAVLHPTYLCMKIPSN